MSRILPELKIYKHEKLMYDLNRLMMSIKVHLGENAEALGNSAERLREKYPLPTSQELNDIQQKINVILKKDYTSMKKH